MPTNLTELVDFAQTASDATGRYRVEMMLPPKNLRFSAYRVPALAWHSIKYGDETQIHQIPDNRRGVYAFVLCEQNGILPHHGYVLYIGIAGRKSNRSLRHRYQDYLNPKKVMKRERIAFMIGNWHEVLRFFFVAVDDTMSSDDLETLERQLNSALIPPFSQGDLEATTKRMRRAFQ